VKTVDVNTAAKHLRLRPDVSISPIGPEHAERMYQWVCDPVIAVALGLRRNPTREYTEQWIERCLNDPLISAYALMLNRSHVGNVVLDRMDSYLKTTRLSVYVGDSAVRGAGVGLTGVYKALADGFGKYDLHKVWLTVDVNNHAALKTYAKLHFKVEGMLRDEFVINGRRSNAYYMALLRQEFEQLSLSITLASESSSTSQQRQR
jgi:RimJ/RimL family protein N-acetyltransferase